MLVSGALFSALHLDAVGFLGLMEIGILLAALRWWTGSLWASILGHAVNNGIAGERSCWGWKTRTCRRPRGCSRSEPCS